MEKNVEKSEKKVEKLMLYLLFANQPGQDAEDELRIDNEVKLEIEDDPSQKTPKDILAKNLISMLKNQRESDGIRHLIDGYNMGRKQTKSKKEVERRRPQLKADIEDESASALPLRHLHP